MPNLSGTSAASAQPESLELRHNYPTPLAVQFLPFRLSPFLIGDVADSTDGAYRLASGARTLEECLRPCGQPADGTVSAYDPMLNVPETVTRGVVGSPDSRFYPLKVLMVDEVDKGLQVYRFIRTPPMDFALLRRPVYGVAEVVVIKYTDV